MSELAPPFASDDKLTFDLIVLARIGKGETEMLKQIEIKVLESMQEVWYASTNKMASLQKKLNLQNLIYCQCFEAEVKLSNIVDQHDFLITAQLRKNKEVVGEINWC